MKIHTLTFFHLILDLIFRFDHIEGKLPQTNLLQINCWQPQKAPHQISGQSDVGFQNKNLLKMHTWTLFHLISDKYLGKKLLVSIDSFDFRSKVDNLRKAFQSIQDNLMWGFKLNNLWKWIHWLTGALWDCLQLIWSGMGLWKQAVFLQYES